jgi:polyhydroxyalkanoate synthase
MERMMTRPTDDSTQLLDLDRLVHASLGKITAGTSPAALMLAYLDWLIHLGIAPGRQFKLVDKAMREMLRCGIYTGQSLVDPTIEPCIKPWPEDNRFSAPEWDTWPYKLFYQGFLFTQQWWCSAIRGVRGVSRHHQDVVWFTTRQWLDMLSPSNFLFTNPEIIKATLEENGANLLRGAGNFLEDAQRQLAPTSVLDSVKMRQTDRL